MEGRIRITAHYDLINLRCVENESIVFSAIDHCAGNKSSARSDFRATRIGNNNQLMNVRKRVQFMGLCCTGWPFRQQQFGRSISAIDRANRHDFHVRD